MRDLSFVFYYNSKKTTYVIYRVKASRIRLLGASSKSLGWNNG